jgi:hypothetical protein
MFPGCSAHQAFDAVESMDVVACRPSSHSIFAPLGCLLVRMMAICLSFCLYHTARPFIHILPLQMFLWFQHLFVAQARSTMFTSSYLYRCYACQKVCHLSCPVVFQSSALLFPGGLLVYAPTHVADVEGKLCVPLEWMVS